MQCPYCLKTEFKSGKSYGAHLTNCVNNPNRREHIKRIQKSKTKKTVYSLTCPKCGVVFNRELTPAEVGNSFHCSRKCANKHQRSEESKLKTSKTMKGRNAQGDLLPMRACEVCGANTPNRRRRTCSQACRIMLIKKGMKLGKPAGGFRNGGGRGKQGHLDGYFFQSTWEIAFYLFHRDRGDTIEKLSSQIFFKYEGGGRTRKFYPDFIVNKELFEVKGPQDPYQEEKRKASLGLVTFVDENALEQEIFPWVREHYGRIEQLFLLYDISDD